MSEKPERRIIIEVATPAIIARLEADNAELRKELKDLRAKHLALHDTVYRLMEVVGDLKRNKGKS